MTIEELIKKIESETTLAKQAVASDEGLLRLQNVAKEYQGEYRLVWSEDTAKEIKDKPQRTNHLSGIKEIDDLTGGFREQQMIGIGAHSGHGKCLAKGTSVLMFDGTTKVVEDIVKGDRIMGPDSNAKTVLGTGQGREEMYTISQRGLSYTVNGSHILSLKTNGNWDSKTKKKRHAGKVVNIGVNEYLKMSDWFKTNYKGWTTGVEFGYKETPIEPYFLGVWLGDGSSSCSTITNIEPEIEMYMENYADRLCLKYKKEIYGDKTPTLSITSGIKGGSHNHYSLARDLRALDLIKNKHIPEVYKLNSRDVRMEVLAGLIDTDGSLYSNNGTCYEITQKSERLSNDIVFLARSLGLAAVMNKCTKTIKSIGFSGEYHHIRISGDIRNIPVRVERKKTDFVPCTNALTNRITVTPIGVGDYYGFELDGDGLFLLGSFVVTHNTAMGMFILKQYESLNPVLIPLEQSSEELIEQRASQGQFVPRYLSPKKHESRVQVDWIEERIIEGIAKYNTKMVVIDHMGYVDAGSRYERAGEHIQIEKKLQDIKHIGIKWNVIVIILIQLNQLDETVPPSLKDLKGSSAIRQECDKVIFLWRKNSLSGKVRIYSNNTMFSLQKNRFNGINGNLGLYFDYKSGEYQITTESRSWVRDMETIAKSEVDADSVFNGKTT